MGRLLRRTDLACGSDQVASAGEFLGAGAGAIGEQAVVADAVSAQKASTHVHQRLSPY